MADESFLIIAHRGASAYELENSFRAFDVALELNSDVLEGDIHVTKDRQLVLMHDPTIDRTTYQRGVIRKMNLEQIEAIPLKNREKIPTLEEFLARYGDKSKLMLELKPNDIAQEVYALIRKYKLMNRVILTSFTFDSLIKLNELDPNLQLAIHTFRTWNYLKTRFSLKKIVKMGIEVILPFHHIFTKTFVRKAHELGFKVYPWTVNKKQVAIKLKNEYDVDGVITNFPDLLD